MQISSFKEINFIKRIYYCQDESEKNFGSIKLLREKLKIIFTFYASFGDRVNIQSLKSGKFHRMMNDLDIKHENITEKSLDLFFIDENKHMPNMSFNTFLECIPKLAKVFNLSFFIYFNYNYYRNVLKDFIKKIIFSG